MTIIYYKNKPVTLQINNLKRNLIELNIVLGKPYTLDIANLLIKLTKLVNYYDTKKLKPRFDTSIQSLALFVSESSNLNDNQINLIKQKIATLKEEFSKSSTNDEKKHLMYDVLFTHVQILVEAYLINEKIASISINLSETDLPKGSSLHEIETDLPKGSSLHEIETELPDGFHLLTPAQQDKYNGHAKKFAEVDDSNKKEKNRLQSAKNYYIRIIKKLKKEN